MVRHSWNGRISSWRWPWTIWTIAWTRCGQRLIDRSDANRLRLSRKDGAAQENRKSQAQSSALLGHAWRWRICVGCGALHDSASTSDSQWRPQSRFHGARRNILPWKQRSIWLRVASQDVEGLCILESPAERKSEHTTWILH